MSHVARGFQCALKSKTFAQQATEKCRAEREIFTSARVDEREKNGKAKKAHCYLYAMTQ